MDVEIIYFIKTFSTIPKLVRLVGAKLKAATHFLSFLPGSSLIPIVFYRDGDGFSSYQF